MEWLVRGLKGNPRRELNLATMCVSLPVWAHKAPVCEGNCHQPPIIIMKLRVNLLQQCCSRVAWSRGDDIFWQHSYNVSHVTLE